jgi:hypothetical protein
VPIQVYLDTSDYWNFANAKAKNDKAILDILDRLVYLRDQRLIDIRYSWIHVFELLNYDSKHRLKAISRCEILSDLTQGRCLRESLKIARSEATAFANGKKLPKKNARAPTGIWIDPLISSDGQKDLTTRQRLTKILKEDAPQLTRQQRRNTERHLLQGKVLKKGIRNSLRERRHEPPNPSLLKKLPLLGQTSGKQFSAIMTDSLTGDLSEEEADRKMWRVMLDPKHLISEIQESFPQLKSSSEIVYSMSGQVLHAAHAAKAEFQSLLSEWPTNSGVKLKLDVDDLIEQRTRSLLLGFLSKEERERLEGSISQTKFLPGSAPSIEALAMAIGHYVGRISDNPNIKPKGSDGGDIAHSMYIPYVDVFRADGPSAEIMKSIGKRFSTSIVSRLSDLLGAIETKQKSAKPIS